VQLSETRPNALRKIGKLQNSDQIMENTLFLGTYPGLTIDMLNHEIRVIKNFVQCYD